VLVEKHISGIMCENPGGGGTAPLLPTPIATYSSIQDIVDMVIISFYLRLFYCCYLLVNAVLQYFLEKCLGFWQVLFLFCILSTNTAKERGTQL